MESVLQLIEEHWSMSTEFRLLLVVSHCHREDYLIRTKGHLCPKLQLNVAHSSTLFYVVK